MIHYYSERGHPLIFWSEPGRKLSDPVITMENYCKWYSLHIVHPYDRGNVVEPISFEVLEDLARATESPYCDHIPNPDVVMRLVTHHTKYRGCELCPRSLEMIRGRWVDEVLRTLING